MRETNFVRTELGLFPINWEILKLIDFCKIKDGTHGTFRRTENGPLLLSAKNISDGKLLISKNESCISIPDYRKIMSIGFPLQGDLLISCVGSIGRCCIFDSNKKIVFQRSVAFLRQKRIDNVFLMYFLQSHVFQKQLNEAKNASTLGGVYIGAFGNLKIFAPSDKIEQSKIAISLESIDNLIEKIARVIEKK